MYEALYLAAAYVVIKICPKKDILYTSLTAKLLDKNTQRKTNTMLKASAQKEVSTKLMKGLLDMIILQFLQNEPMHGYQIITKIRKNFGIYFGPSTIYPLLGTLEKKGYVASTWNMNYERPRKIYSLTSEGQSMLSFTEESLNMICRRITVVNPVEEQPTIGIIAPKSRSHYAIEVP
jgi:DNA-binding PadR family transcriptional regulator